MIIALLAFAAACLLAGAAVLATDSEAPKRLQSRLQKLNPAAAPAASVDRIGDFTRPEAGGSTWLARWLSRADWASRAGLLLYQADVSASLGKLLFIAIAGASGAASLVYLQTGAMEPALLCAALVFPSPLVYVLRKRAKRLAMFEQQLPDAIDTMVRALRVGHSLVAAIGALAQDTAEPLKREFRTCFEEQSYGVEIRTAILNLAHRVPLVDVRMFVAALLVQKECGGNLAEVLEKVAQTNRERFRIKRQIRVHTAQGRVTGWILSLLPVFLGFGMYLVNPEGIGILWRRPIGLKMLRAAVAMTLTGGMVIRRIVHIRV